VVSATERSMWSNRDSNPLPLEEEIDYSPWFTNIECAMRALVYERFSQDGLRGYLWSNQDSNPLPMGALAALHNRGQRIEDRSFESKIGRRIYITEVFGKPARRSVRAPGEQDFF